MTDLEQILAAITALVDEQAQRIRELEADCRELDEDGRDLYAMVGQLESNAAHNRERIAELEAKAERLTKALNKYGKHDHNCSAYPRIGELTIHNERCDCGLAKERE